jgi:ABC-2 type transport system permease protein
MTTFIIAGRVLKQLKGDKKYLALSIVAPLIIIYFLKLLFDSFPPGSPATNFTIPVGALIVHFLSFLLCAILLVQERTRGTLERMLISGCRRTSIIGGYTFGYLALATIQAAAVLFELLWLFDLNYNGEQVFMLFLVIWLLAIVSVMLGIFVSTFAQHEGHVFPFIPLIILPSVFLTGLLIDTSALPAWAAVVGKCLPLHYAVNIIHEIMKPDYDLSATYLDFAILIGYIFLLWAVASITLKETE